MQIRVGLLIGNSELSVGRQMLIASQDDLNLVFIESSGERALERLNDFNVDVLIVDQRTSDIDGLVFLKRLFETFSVEHLVAPKIIFQSPYYSRDLQVSVIGVGASGILTIENSSDEILSKIREVAQTQGDIDVDDLMHLFSEIEFEPLGQVALTQALEASEVALLKLLRLYSRGVKIREIANQTNSSQVAVRKSIDDFCFQNGFATRSQLLLALYRTGQLKDG